MKKKYLVYLSLGLSLFLAHDAFTNSGGAPSGTSGSPASNGNGCNRAGCHNGPAVSGQTVSITTNIPSSGFKADSIYEITITANNNGSGTDRMGFMASVESPAGHEGSIAITDAARTKKSGNYITHTSSGISGSAGVNSWTFEWNAAQAPDQATVYTSVNFANQNGTTSGDVIVNQTLSLDKNLGIGEPEFALLKVSAYPNPATDFLFVAANEALVSPFTVWASDGKSFAVAAEAQDVQHYRIDVNHLASGVYTLRDAAGHQVRFRKQ